jgi:hypothetical protein
MNTLPFWGRDWHGFCSFVKRKGGKMRKQGIMFIILCLALCGSLGFSLSQEEEYYDYSFARLNYVNGNVFLQRVGDMGYEEGTVNLPIVEGDKLGTQDGRAEIHFGRNNYLRIDNYTQVDFAKLPRNGDDSISLHLLSGNIYLRVNTLSQEKEFEIHSPDGSFYVLEEGLYRLEVSESQETVVSVIEGSIEAAGEEGFEIVRAGERLIAASGFFTSAPQYIYAGNEDAFCEWSRGRDIFHNRYVRTRYLPVGMSDYEAELDYYGRWVYERPYGYVWIPDVYHDTWRPYYHGRWIWYPVCGWTWCAYEPWGWCVSHYGRWHWRIGLGWYWIPTQRWGPAWVHWYHGGDYLGWSPLSYYNRPVVIVNNHFYDRHYDRYYPAHSRAFTVIRKDQLSARHISKVALSPSHMSRLGNVSLSSRQPTVRPAVSSIGIKNSAASSAFSRSNVRSVSRSYASDRTIRSSIGRNIASPSQNPGLSNRSGTVSKSSVRSIQRDGRYTSSISTSIQSRSAIKTYPSRNSSSLQRSPTSSRSSSSLTGIRTYPSLRTSIRRSQTSSAPKAGSTPSGISPRTRTTIKQYSPSSLSPSRSSYTTSRRSVSPNNSASTRIRSYSSGLVSSSRSTSASATRRYTSSSRPSISSRLSLKSSSSRSAYRSSSSSRSSYTAPSRNSYSPSRLSSSKSVSPSRSFKSSSSSRISRSTPSRSSSRSISRSRSTGKVKKK